MPRGSSKVACPLCGAEFWGRYTLSDHLAKAHTPCPYCDKSFIRLMMHVRLGHPQWYPEWVATRARPANSEG